MGEKYEGTCVPCVNQKVTSAEEEFNNQVDKKTCPLDSQPVAPAIPGIAQYAHGHSSCGDQDGSYAWRQ